MENTIQHIFPQSITQAICHTLLHSLWEGLFMALFTGLVIILTKNATAALRYRLLVTILALFTMAIAATFIFELNGVAKGDSEHPTSSSPINERLFSVVAVWCNGLLKSANEHAGLVCYVWLIVVSVQNTRLIIGIYAFERLKRVKVQTADAYWQETANRLSRVLKIRQAVLLMESAIAKVPIVIGYLKPVILVPLGLVNSLEPAQVEAILLHELAHIRRNDYLANLLLTVLETFFFFNPAVLWLSWLIRTEREHCCDDIVISQTQNKVEYVRALIHFEEYRIALPRRSVALTGPSGNMLNRLERIITGKNRSLGKLELVVLAIMLLLGTLFVVASPQPQVQFLLKTHGPEFRSTIKDQEAKKKAEAADLKRRNKASP